MLSFRVDYNTTDHHNTKNLLTISLFYIADTLVDSNRRHVTAAFLNIRKQPSTFSNVSVTEPEYYAVYCICTVMFKYIYLLSVHQR